MAKFENEFDLKVSITIDAETNEEARIKASEELCRIQANIISQNVKSIWHENKEN
jgi:hypothetical protein